VWKHLDGKHALDDLVGTVRAQCDDVSEDVSQDVATFVDELVEHGLAGLEAEAV